MRNALAMLTLMASGCMYYGDVGPGPAPGPGPGPVTVVNYAPVVLDGAAYVYWDDYYYDDIWSFEAVVDDPDGLGDVISVFADVYDDFSGQRIETLELLPSYDDPTFWYSDWYGSSLYLDPYGYYTVDIIVYDSFDDFGVLTVPAQTYYY